MCGIISVKQLNGRPAADKVLSQYMSQKTRGQQGFGFIEILKNRITLRRFVYEDAALGALKKSKSSEIIFHHRIPTSTMNSALCNQPIIISSDMYKHNYYIFHNGVISNCDDLKKKHEELGIKYSSVKDDEYNDSEALGHELALVIEGIKEKKEFDVGGSIAFILLQTDKNNKAIALFFGRNYNNPLTLTVVEDMFMEIRSAGGEKDIPTHKLFRYDYERQVVENIEFNYSKLFVPTTMPLALPGGKDAEKYEGVDDDIDDALNKIEGYTAQEAGLNKTPSSGVELYTIILGDKMVDFISLLRLDKEALLRLIATARTRYKELMNRAYEAHSSNDAEENTYYFTAGMQKKNIELILRALKTR